VTLDPFPLTAPHPLTYEPLLRRAFEEDLGLAGDLTTEAVVPPDAMASGVVAARQRGIVAGVDIAARAFTFYDAAVDVRIETGDGTEVKPGDVLARVAGPARSLLTAERTALNLLGRLSGIATLTASVVDAVAGTRAAVVCTRKTTPGLRALEKYAVRAGGGSNHRFGLDDAVLVKDNHIAIAGSVTNAVARVRRRVGHLVKVEVEVDDLDQLDELLGLGADAVLLDNLGPDRLAEAVRRVGGRMITEASGGITPETAHAIAASGVDLLSLGWLTHSPRSLDVGLDL
jgi:nicotinate-nucleotide pyrophosphorylase (carboxylating)